MTAVSERHQSIDAVRGFAVLGILLMNIVAMGLPSFAYLNPTYAGGSTGADFWTWALNNTFTDGKMRALFTLLFGASTLLIADRAERGPLSPVATHYRRMFWLLIIGLAHAVFFWFGDILVPYAVAGLVIFPLRRLKPRTLIIVGVAILALLLAKNVFEAGQLRGLYAAVHGPNPPAALVAQWNTLAPLISPAPGAKEAEIAAFGAGSFMEAAQARMALLSIFYSFIHPFDTVPEAIGQMLIGMALFRLGFFTLGWSSRAYTVTIAVGYGLAAPLTAWLGYQIVQTGFAAVELRQYEVWQQLTRPFIALAHASVLLLVIRAGWAEALTNRLAAAGRMAFSNYLMTSIITAAVFGGWGLGLFGKLSRFEQLAVVAGVWAFILLWSLPWLQRFHYGPFEWAWRSLVQWRLQPFVRGGKPSTASA
jgi:uncharacterized protein